MNLWTVPAAIPSPVIPVAPVIIIVPAAVPVWPAHCGTYKIVRYGIIIRIRIHEIRVSNKYPVIRIDII
jgi:hypothetical protein